MREPVDTESSEHSAVTNRLAVPPVKLTAVANRAFPVVGPWTWNDLPDDVTSAESLSTFHQRLYFKTHQILFLIIPWTGWTSPNQFLVDLTVVCIT